jgi:hypothetical protein
MLQEGGCKTESQERYRYSKDAVNKSFQTTFIPCLKLDTCFNLVRWLNHFFVHTRVSLKKVKELICIIFLDLGCMATCAASSESASLEATLGLMSMTVTLSN